MKVITTYSKLNDEKGQGTVEFAIVFGALISILIGIGTLSNIFSDGKLFEHILSSASHNITQAAEGVVDVFVY